MDEWWAEIDDEILAALRANGRMDPERLGKQLGMSTAAVCSCLGMLAAQQKVRISSVELPPGRLTRLTAA